MKLTLTAPAPQSVYVDLEYMDEGVWRAEVPTGEKTEIQWKAEPKNYQQIKKGRLNTPLCFYAVKTAKVMIPEGQPGAIASAEFQWTGNDGVMYPWQKDPAPREQSDGMTWWPGVDHNNAGHFGFRYEPNGLLINNVSFDRIDRSWYYFKPGRNDESFQFNFGIPGAIQPKMKEVQHGDDTMAAQQEGMIARTGLLRQIEYVVDQGVYAQDDIQADWTHVRWSRDVKTIAGKTYKQTLRYSTLAVGVQVETDSPMFDVSFQDNGISKSPSVIVVPTREGVKIYPAGKTFSPKQMAENWLVLLSNDGTGEIPVLLVFQHRPQKLSWGKNGQLRISRRDGVGTIAIGTPFGATVQPADLLTQWLATPGEIPAERFRKFANLLAAYPWVMRENFAVRDGWVYLRDTFEFLPWQDDWGTTPQPYSPLPPLVSYAIQLGQLPKSCVANVTDLDIVTKWGPYWARQGATLDYKLPIPRMWDYYPLAVERTENNARIYDVLQNSLTPQAIESLKADVAPFWYTHFVHDHCSAALRSSNYLPPELRQKLSENVHTQALRSLYPQAYRYRKDPITGAEYLACTFTWMGENDGVNGEGYADIDYWQGITLYGLYTQAKYSDDWETIRKYWPTIRSMLSFWESQHSWAMMSPGAREAGEIEGGDMPAAGYAGLVAFYQMARYAGTDYQRDLAAYLLALNAVPRTVMFGFVDWAKKLQHQELRWGDYTSGYGERWVTSVKNLSNDVHDMSAKDPWWATGPIGPQGSPPELLDLFIERDPKRAAAWENSFRENCPDDGFIAKQRPDNVMSHIMFRMYLSDILGDNAWELMKQYPHKTHMLRHVHVLAGLLAWECPVRLLDWTPAQITAGKWDSQNKQAIISLTSKTPAQVRLAVQFASPVVLLDDQPIATNSVDTWEPWRVVEFSVPAGEHTIVVKQNK